MATATAHPNHQLISSEDVEGVNVYDMKGTKIGEVDHLMIDKISGRVSYDDSWTDRNWETKTHTHYNVRPYW